MEHQGAAVQPPAQDDQPVLPANYFNNPALSGNWSWEADFTDVMEIGKGKVRAAAGGGCLAAEGPSTGTPNACRHPGRR